MEQIPVLIIHRDQQLVRTLRQLLNENGFAVDIAPNGSGVDLFVDDDSYKVILFDPNDPLSGGLKMLQRWRRDGLKAHVLAISDNQCVQAKVQCFDHGTDDYVPAAFHPQELLARLRVATRRSASELNGQQSILKTHDLVIDVDARIVTRSGERIVLTPREFALLRLLAMRKGRPVTRTTIWEILYDRNSSKGSNVVDVFIRRLRIKIDRDFDPPLILTRYGQGYLLCGDDD